MIILNVVMDWIHSDHNYLLVFNQTSIKSIAGGLPRPELSDYILNTKHT